MIASSSGLAEDRAVGLDQRLALAHHPRIAQPEGGFKVAQISFLERGVD
jgi:hypothetical protein